MRSSHDGARCSFPEGARALVGDAPARLRLRHGPVAIDVLSHDASSLVWLAEFLGPSFAQRASGRPDHRVFFGVAPTLYAELAGRLREARGRPLDGFGFDGRFSRHTSLRDASGRTWVRDPYSAVLHGVDAPAREVLVAARREGDRPRVALMRAVRELAVSALLRAGRLPVHGAAFADRGGAVLICGPKRSGKTSLLVHALACGGAFLSNDRVFVDVTRAATATPMPTIVMLRNGTLSHFPRLLVDFERAHYDRARTLRECGPGVARPEPRARRGFDRPGISPAQLCALLGAPVRASAPVRAIVFPRIDPRTRGLELRALPTPAARSRLGRSLMKPSHPTRLSALFSPGRRRETLPARVEREACGRLAGRVPAFECRLGADAYRGDLLAELRTLLD
ncbi:MAG TPA: hypothetical protein VMS55_22730 [Myxococcota bacterium]|nr:hypothetical protein [Myxococcota bacterium]